MFTIKNAITGCTSIDLNATLGFEPFDYLSCFGDGRYCGQFNTLNWPGSSSELPIAILLMGLYLYFIVLGAFATSDGGKPKYPWLLVSKVFIYLQCAIIFICRTVKREIYILTPVI